MTLGPGLQRTPLPLGFSSSGVNCGVRRYRPDLGLIVSEKPAVAAGVYTKNNLKAAPITYCASILPSDRIRAIVTNSGQANAATGARGEEANREMASATAQHVGCAPAEVLTASTGVIGKPLDLEKIVAAMPELVARLSDTADNFALSILTTDLVPKSASTELELSSGVVRLTGIAKGSGMIHPNMGTMLGYFLCDAILTKSQAEELLKQSVDVSFNMISVDGDMSTNDCCFLLANGASGVSLKTPEDLNVFKNALIEVSQMLAQAIAIDGEGATKLIEVRVKRAPTQELARRAARGVTLSPLVKTAIHGENPNWGRILARLGAEDVPVSLLETLCMTMQGITLFDEAKPVVFSVDEMKSLLKKSKVEIEVDFKIGEQSATAWGCDLSRKYVDINTEYS